MMEGSSSHPFRSGVSARVSWRLSKLAKTASLRGSSTRRSVAEGVREGGDEDDDDVGRFAPSPSLSDMFVLITIPSWRASTQKILQRSSLLIVSINTRNDPTISYKCEYNEIL